MISKEEINFFDILNSFDLNILHKQFLVNISRCKCNDKNVKIYDGYLKTDNGIILFEYDGSYWHNEDNDKLYDDCVLDIRKDILAIIRYNDHYVKYLTKLKDINKIKEDTINAIEEIKNNKKGIYKFYRKSA